MRRCIGAHWVRPPICRSTKTSGWWHRRLPCTATIFCHWSLRWWHSFSSSLSWITVCVEVWTWISSPPHQSPSCFHRLFQRKCSPYIWQSSPKQARRGRRSCIHHSILSHCGTGQDAGECYGCQNAIEISLLFPRAGRKAIFLSPLGRNPHVSTAGSIPVGGEFSIRSTWLFQRSSLTHCP